MFWWSCPSCLACSKGRLQVAADGCKWHWHCGDCYINYALSQSSWLGANVSKIRKGWPHSMDSDSQPCWQFGSRKMQCHFILPCFHGMWCGNGKGKKTAWQTWNVYNQASATFEKRSHCPSKVEDSDLQVLERFVVLMYDRSCSVSSVNEARLDLFARKQRPYDLIPPTQSALKEHVKRVAYQAGHIWGQCVVRQPEPECPSRWGWAKENDIWKIVWTLLEPISKSCLELTKCGCKNKV